MINDKCKVPTKPPIERIKADVFQTFLQFKFNTCLQRAFFTFKMQYFVL